MRIQTNTYASISSGSRNYTTKCAAVHGVPASPEGVKEKDDGRIRAPSPPQAVKPPPPPERSDTPSLGRAQHQAGVDAAEAERVLDQVARGDVAAAGGNDVEVAGRVSVD